MTIERRLGFRKIEENQVYITSTEMFRDQAISSPSGCVTRDISIAGTKIVIDSFLSVLDKVNLEVKLAKPGKNIRSAAVVRWIRQIPETESFEAGLEFTELDPEDEMILIDDVYDVG